MANEAHKEPTMEEILASIRKIISDDDAPPTSRGAVSESDVKIEDADNDDFDAFDVDDLDAVAPPAADAGGDAIFAEEKVAPPVADMVADADEAEASAPPVVEPDPEPVPEPEPAAPVATAAPASRTPDMPATSTYEKTVLTEEQTADAAAGALGKLISRMDLGGDNTIEGLVREMLKPMIKEWLDSNLPQIVEEKVEAEVQRIARMAR